MAEIRVSLVLENAYGRPWAGPITLRIGDRHTCGDRVVGPPGSRVRVGSMPLRTMDLVPDPASKDAAAGQGHPDLRRAPARGIGPDDHHE